mmetsp:Transcript_4669/g.8933  ORF Transcript_4669/g.8933 Transcript_4669/m.8933 type:complete len:249 (-) Transcript_4669:28-774(-)
MKTFMYTAMAALATSAAAMPGIRETDSDLLYVNLLVDPAVIEDYLNPAFTLDTYNGKAMVSVMALHIDKLEMQLPFDIWMPTGSSSYLAKTVTYAKHGDEVGYIILSMDFTSLTESLGCSATQPGVICEHSKYSRDDTNVYVSASNDVHFNATYTIGTEDADADLLEWVIPRAYKFLQDGVGEDSTAYHGAQDGKDDPSLVQGVKVDVTDLDTNMLSERFGWDDASWELGPCFRSDGLLFVDHTADKI